MKFRSIGLVLILLAFYGWNNAGIHRAGIHVAGMYSREEPALEQGYDLNDVRVVNDINEERTVGEILENFYDHRSSFFSSSGQVLRLLADNPIISEFMADNASTLVDEDGDYSDWIEIYNPSLEAINLEGWSLTDDPADLQKWTFPPFELGPRAYQAKIGENRSIGRPSSTRRTSGGTVSVRPNRRRTGPNRILTMLRGAKEPPG